MIAIEIYNPELYPVLKEWWKGHGWDPVPECVFPKLGVVARVNGNPTAAAWLYMDNSVGVSMMEWVVSDPFAAPRHVAVAICSIVRFLKAEAKSLDYGVMLATCKQESLSRLFVREGFQATDRSMIHHVALT